MNAESPVFPTPVQRPSAVDDVIRLFQEALIRGDLQPGQRLPAEARLGQQLGVGYCVLAAE